MADRDYEWPTFEETDTRVNYSPNADREKIFTEFQLAKERESAKNKKKKKKSKDKSGLRLTSESEVIGNRYKGRNVRRLLIYGAVIITVIVVVGLAVGLGVHFGMTKNSDEPSVQASQSETTADVSMETLPPLPSSSSSVFTKTTTALTDTIPSSTKQTTMSTTTSTTSSTTKATTTTSTTTTPTTTTTTTTPAPTRPPTLSYSVKDEHYLVKQGITCWTDTMYTYSNSMSEQEKCSLFGKFVQCVYYSMLLARVFCPVQTLIVIVQNNSDTITPAWTGFYPTLCQDLEVSALLGNVSALPMDKDSLCDSVDAVRYFGQQNCYTSFNDDQLKQETPETHCKLYWSYLGCIAGFLQCSYSNISQLVDTRTEQLTIGQTHFNLVNQSVCQDYNRTLFTTDGEEVAGCQLEVYRTGALIGRKCSPLIQVSQLVQRNENLRCKLYNEFNLCVDRLVDFPCVTSTMKESAYEISELEVRLSTIYRPHLMNISSCDGHIMSGTDICTGDTALLVAVIDSGCSQIIQYTSPTRLCQDLEKYIECGVNVLKTTQEVTCTKTQVREAIVQQADMLSDVYVDVRSQIC